MNFSATLRVSVAVMLTAIAPAAAWGATIYATDFEQSEGYSLGGLNGQQSWTADTDTTVQGGQKSSGDQGVQMTADGSYTGQFNLMASLALTDPSGTYSQVTIAQDVMVTAPDEAEYLVATMDGTTRTNSVVFNYWGGITVNGVYTGASWVVGGWQALEMTLNFAAGTMDVTYGGTLIADDVAFEAAGGVDSLLLATDDYLFAGSSMYYDKLSITGESGPPSVPPVADAGGPYCAQATSWDGATVSLDGSASYDPDGLNDPTAIVGYEWDLNLAVDSNGDGNPANDVDATGALVSATFPVGQRDISLTVVDNDLLRSAPDVTTVTVSEISVAIDIKPGAFPNTINLASRGAIPVAFLSSPGFDAATIDPSTVTLRGEDFTSGLIKLKGNKNPQPMASLVDVDGDGDLDLLVHLDTQILATYELTSVCTMGALTNAGFVVSGSDTIQLVQAP